MGQMYRSTMGIDPPVDMRTMVFKGKPSDGGLYLPTEWESFSQDEIRSMKDMSVQEVGYHVGKKLFGKDIDDQSLQKISERALGFDIPIELIDDDIYLMRLDRGPTGAFKDVAARYMAQVIGHYTKDIDKEMTIIVATSGDTGAAVASAFHNVPGIKVYVMYPEKEVSGRQALLMNTLGGNVYSRAVDTKFDYLQKWAQMLMDDPDLEHINRNSANSIHFLRLGPQTIYHIYGSSKIRDDTEPVIKADSSGNFGNATSDVIAMKYLGNPVEKIIVATNENDEFPLFMATGGYSPIEPSRDCISKAMNVGNPSNLRRLFYIYGGKIDGNGNVLEMPDLGKMRKDLFAISVSDGVTRERISKAAEKGIPVEQHGAVSLEGAYRYKEATKTTKPILVTETAAPWKFPEVLDELGVQYKTPDWVLDIEKKESFNEKLPGDYEAIKEDFLSI